MSGPTDCPSAAASAPHRLSKYERSCARSGRLHGRVRRAGLSFPFATRMTAPSRHRTTWHDGRSLESHPVHDHTLHHGRWYHASTTGEQHDGHWHHARSRSRPPHTSTKGVPTTFPSGRTGWHSAAASAL